MLSGSCLCGAVKFSVHELGASVTACHCKQCRKQSGHHWASGYASKCKIDIQGNVRWFAASKFAQRGFCPRCGSFLFWDAHDEGGMSFALGAIDGPTGLHLKKHIFTAHKGDYYEIADDVPQRED